MVETKSTNLSKWDEKLKASAEEEYESFRNVLEWTDGFGLVFVQCAPVQGDELITKFTKDLITKKIAVLSFQSGEEICNLYDLVDQMPNRDQIDILFIRGLEYSFVPYIKPGYGGQGDYYKLDNLPPILGHLNLQRERFRRDFEICFVFLLPFFGIKYFIQRAPDFFDWRSGLFTFPEQKEQLIPQLDSRTLKRLEWLGYGCLFLVGLFLGVYLSWLIASVLMPILGVLIGLLVSGLGKAIRLRQTKQYANVNFLILILRGSLATQSYFLGTFWSGFGTFKKSCFYFERAIEFDPDYYQAWNNRGIALGNLGRLEEAIASYNKAVKIKPDHHYPWNNRGIALENLGRLEEAIASYDNALKIKPDYHQAWNNRGIALSNLGRNEEAITSYDNLLKIKPDNYEAWNNRGIALSNLGRNEEAITSYDNLLKIKPDNYEAWNNRGIALSNLGRNEEAITSYDNLLKIKPDYASAYFNKACAYALQENISLAIDNLTQAINLDSKSFEMAKTDNDFDKIRNDRRFIDLINQSDSP